MKSKVNFMPAKSACESPAFAGARGRNNYTFLNGWDDRARIEARVFMKNLVACHENAIAKQAERSTAQD